MILINRLKILLRQRGILVWTLLFPLILASFEYAAFGNLLGDDIIEPMEIMLTNEENYKVEMLYETVFQEATINDGEGLFIITYYETFAEAIEVYKSNTSKIFLFNEENKLTISAYKNSINLTIIEEVILKTSTIKTTIEKAYKKYYQDQINGLNPLPVNEEEIKLGLTKNFDYMNDVSINRNSNNLIIYFFGLIAMACLYASYWGQMIIQDIRADQSDLGVRIGVSPTSKRKLVINYFLAALILQIVSNITLLIFLRFILKINFGTNIGMIFLTMLIGSITGITFGMFTSCILKVSARIKEGFLTLATLALSAMAGLMSIEIKFMIDKNIPFLNYLNPSALISNAFYSLYYYNSYSKYFVYLGGMVLLSLVFTLITIVRMRGEKYANL